MYCSCSILKEHAVISVVDGTYEIRPASLGAKSKVNGTSLTGPRVLTHKDRILFGENLAVGLLLFFAPCDVNMAFLQDQV